MKNIVLIGMPGCGKTTLGAQLAQAVHREFYDTDQYVERQEQTSIAALFAQGEARFRQAETQALGNLATYENLVLATGGGVVTRPQNMEILRRGGSYIIFIERPLATLCAEVELSTRPLLAIGGSAKLACLYKERLPLYQQFSDARLENNAPLDEVLARLIALVKEADL
ncbi:MAG: shikimate kinase [Acidaminococcaceae bacterium]